eukprot:4990846-Amphidinium_carterae.1
MPGPDAPPLPPHQDKPLGVSADRPQTPYGQKDDHLQVDGWDSDQPMSAEPQALRWGAITENTVHAVESSIETS